VIGNHVVRENKRNMCTNRVCAAKTSTVSGAGQIQYWKKSRPAVPTVEWGIVGQQDRSNKWSEEDGDS
jgi:hypothetical protein